MNEEVSRFLLKIPQHHPLPNTPLIALFSRFDEVYHNDGYLYGKWSTSLSLACEGSGESLGFPIAVIKSVSDSVPCADGKVLVRVLVE